MRRTALERKTRFKKQNKARKERLFRKQYHSAERVAWIRSQPCCVCGVMPSYNAHVTSRGAGGTWRDVVPLCARCHHRQHQVGIETFRVEVLPIHLEGVARWYAEEWDRREMR